MARCPSRRPRRWSRWGESGLSRFGHRACHVAGRLRPLLGLPVRTAAGSPGKYATVSCGDVVPNIDDTWDERAREAVEYALYHLTGEGSCWTLQGQGVRYEMWGIY